MARVFMTQQAAEGLEELPLTMHVGVLALLND